MHKWRERERERERTTSVVAGTYVHVLGKVQCRETLQHLHVMPCVASPPGCGRGRFFRSLGFIGSSPIGSTCFPPNVADGRPGEIGREVGETRCGERNRDRVWRDGEG